MKKLILVFINQTAFITLKMKGQVERTVLWEAVPDAVLWLHSAHLVKCSGILMQNIDGTMLIQTSPRSEGNLIFHHQTVFLSIDSQTHLVCYSETLDTDVVKPYTMCC